MKKMMNLGLGQLRLKKILRCRNYKYIQKIVDFDDDHLYEFSIGKNPRNKGSSIPKKTKLNEIYPITGYKLYYLFDFGDCWLFQIKKERK